MTNMTTTRCVGLFLLSLLSAVSCMAKDPAQADIVQRFFPTLLRTGSDLAAGVKPGRLDSQFVVTGHDIIAAYSNAWEGDVRVLHRTGDTWSVAAGAPIAAAGGVRAVRLRDLDGDGIPEVEAVYGTPSGRSEETWLFPLERFPPRSASLGMHRTKLRRLLTRPSIRSVTRRTIVTAASRRILERTEW